MTATGLKPTTNDSYVGHLLANFGAPDPSQLVTTLNGASGVITAANGITADAGTLKTGTWSSNPANNGPITANAGPGGLTLAQPMSNGGADVTLSATGPLTVSANLTTGGNVNLNGGTITLAANTAITSSGSQYIQAPDGFNADASSVETAGDNNLNNQNVSIAVGPDPAAVSANLTLPARSSPARSSCRTPPT